MLKRLLFFAYGVASYLIFLATFLYAIAFVGGFAVPRRLDGPLETSLPTALAIDFALLTIFAVQHSVMARRWFKERWTQIVPWTIERSTYVLCASLALLLLFWQWRPIGIQIWSVENATARVVLWTLFAAGWATVLMVTFLINHFDLFGLRQVWLPLIGRPYTRVSFRTPLPYRFVRHPLYFGFLLAFWMTPTMTLAHLVFALVTTAYIVLAIQFEETGSRGGARRRVRGVPPAAFRCYCRDAGRSRQRHRQSMRRMTGETSATRRRARVLSCWSAHDVGATRDQARTLTSPHHQAAQDPRSRAGDFVKVVREATERFRDVSVAEAEGYALLFGCVSGPDWGAMGLHYVNFPLVIDGVLDPTRPEIVIYEPRPDGRLRITGADYLVLRRCLACQQLRPHRSSGGQLLHFFESPNRFGLPAVLHAACLGVEGEWQWRVRQLASEGVV